MKQRTEHFLFRFMIFGDTHKIQNKSIRNIEVAYHFQCAFIVRLHATYAQYKLFKFMVAT